NDIKEYFELNKETYATPKKVRARHILFRIEPGSTQEQRDELRNKAWVLMEQARSGKDFAKLAKEYSDDPGTKNKGGDLGYFAKDRMVKPFSDAAFAMKSGEISEPILSRFGWHIIKVEAIQEAKEPVITDIQDEIRNKLVKKAARRLAYDMTEEFYDASYGIFHIKKKKKRRGVEVLETAFFARNDRVDGIKEALKFAKVAFNLNDNETSEPLELTDGYYILEVIGKKEAQIPELTFVEEKVYNDLTKVTQNELARKDADKFLQAVKDGAEFQAAAEDFEPKVETTDFFKRFDSVPGIGREQNLAELAFSLSQTKPLPDRVIKGRKAYNVIHLKERQDADVKDFEAKKTQIKSGIISEKRQALMNEWFAQLRRQGEVSIQKGFLD
ncbi:MAG: peptidylprolyl isomerase, partial [Deltaproteobacteria bacterium]|nr:peptidylprolyl isomerase [Deltaproteobacteria bacterium]